MMADFATRWPDRQRPLVVVGIRTSGSYLAPLCAAFLKRRGFQDVIALTMRPDRGISRSDLKVLQAAIRQNGLVLVVDDPPVTGSSYVKVIEEIERAGVPSVSVVLIVPLFGSRDTLAPLLHQVCCRDPRMAGLGDSSAAHAGSSQARNSQATRRYRNH